MQAEVQGHASMALESGIGAALREAVAGRRSKLRPRGYLPARLSSLRLPISIRQFRHQHPGWARYGYSLLWVVLAANLVAMLFQALSAKLGIVTGRNWPSFRELVFHSLSPS